MSEASMAFPLSNLFSRSKVLTLILEKWMAEDNVDPQQL
jgi:hypothetical protein